MESFSKVLVERLDRELGGTFKNLKKRMRVWADVDKYNWKEDESIWRQKRDKESKDYEVYLDGEYVCAVLERDGEQRCYLRVLEGIRNLYKEGKIFVNEEMYQIREAEHEQKLKDQKVLEMPYPYTPEEKVVAGAIEKSAKKKGKKVKYAR